MGVSLTWQETNVGEDGHRVYRDTSPMDPEDLPTALAELGPNVTSYDDDTAVDDTLYYYRVSAYKGSSERVSSEISITTSPSVSLLPELTDENATFNDEGDSTTGWTPTLATLSVSGSWLRMTKNTASAGNAKMSRAITLPGTNKDFRVYSKVRVKSGGANEAGVLWLYDGGSKVAGIWFNYKSTATITAGTVSLQGHTTSPQNAVAATGLDLQTDGLEFVMDYDHKFSSLAIYFKELDGTWSLKARVAHTWFSVGTIDFWSLSGSPNGFWMEFDYLMIARPNLVVIGDSIAEGKTLYSPNRSLGLSNYESTWARYFSGYSHLRNSLISNKGVGSETSTATLARIADATDHGAKVVFIHASSNDYVGGISDSTRTSNITSMVTAVEAAGAEAVILNAMYGTSDMTDNPAHKNYMKNWWDTSRTSVGAFSTIDIMTPLLSGDYMASGLTQSDKIHPTAGSSGGYKEIGDYLEVQ